MRPVTVLIPEGLSLLHIAFNIYVRFFQFSGELFLRRHLITHLFILILQFSLCILKSVCFIPQALIIFISSGRARAFGFRTVLQN